MSAASNYGYASKAYWDKRYAECLIEHEWYYSFKILEPLIVESINWTNETKVLEVGCGDRPLVKELAELDINVGKIEAIDYSQRVIDLLLSKQKKGELSNKINFSFMDACNMTYPSNSFDLVLEKGTMDAILSDKRKGISNAVKLISSIVNVMKPTSTLLLVSHIEIDTEEFELLTHKILLPSLGSKFDVHWKIEAHVVSVPKAETTKPQQQLKSSGKKRKRKDSSLDKDEKVEEQENNISSSMYGTVYLIKSTPRKVTRHSALSGTITMEVKHYGDDDDDDVEEEDVDG
jgi:EEF1A lysine methyltransferase 4